MKNGRIISVVMFATVLGVTAAQARDNPPKPAKPADKMEKKETPVLKPGKIFFEKGRELYDQKNFKGALEAWEMATDLDLRLDQLYMMMANMGFAYDQLAANTKDAEELLYYHKQAREKYNRAIAAFEEMGKSPKQYQKILTMEAKSIRTCKEQVVHLGALINSLEVQLAHPPAPETMREPVPVVITPTPATPPTQIASTAPLPTSTVTTPAPSEPKKTEPPKQLTEEEDRLQILEATQKKVAEEHSAYLRLRNSAIATGAIAGGLGIVGAILAGVGKVQQNTVRSDFAACQMDPNRACDFSADATRSNQLLGSGTGILVGAAISAIVTIPLAIIAKRRKVDPPGNFRFTSAPGIEVGAVVRF